MVCPRYEKRRVVLPMEGAFEKVGSGTIRRAVNEGDACLRCAIIDFDALFVKIFSLRLLLIAHHVQGH